MWKIEYEAPAGSRIFKEGVCWVTIMGYAEDSNNTGSADLWWSTKYQKWVPLKDTGDDGASSCAPCKSFKAFEAHLRRHPELKGCKVVLANRYVGHDITATWKEDA